MHDLVGGEMGAGWQVPKMSGGFRMKMSMGEREIALPSTAAELFLGLLKSRRRLGLFFSR